MITPDPSQFSGPPEKIASQYTPDELAPTQPATEPEATQEEFAEVFRREEANADEVSEEVNPDGRNQSSEILLDVFEPIVVSASEPAPIELVSTESDLIIEQVLDGELDSVGALEPIAVDNAISVELSRQLVSKSLVSKSDGETFLQTATAELSAEELVATSDAASNLELPVELKTLALHSSIDVDGTLQSDVALQPVSSNDSTPIAGTFTEFQTTAIQESSPLSNSAPNAVEQPTDLSKAVVRRVTETLVREVRLTEGIGDSKQITLQLHPAELGRLVLQVAWENETVTAQVVASELATSEMLNRDKSILIDYLSEHGLELASFDVSHGSGFEESLHDQSNSESDLQSILNNESDPVSENTINDQGSVLNIVV